MRIDRSRPLAKSVNRSRRNADGADRAGQDANGGADDYEQWSGSQTTVQ
jgi:hypothetical protein